MNIKTILQSLKPKQVVKSLQQRRLPLFPTEEADPEVASSRMERKRQVKESKLDRYMYRASIVAFSVICLMLSLIPIVYFLPWEKAAEWLVYLLLVALFLSFTLSAVTVKKQSRYIKLPHMWGIMLFSIFLFSFYLFIMVYFRFFLTA
ncbi:hypothetical protein [Bacillus piscicola]|uniref:hypothetical protein n=1 Tax=Bacillus piscicola TaxID=1632684 RepID=UPI001F08CE2E|nr:hypothetical protein [Bacillus piscicola]